MLVAYRNFSLFTEPVGTIGERDVYKLIIQGVEFSVRARKMSPLLDECLDLCNEVSVSHGKSVENLTYCSTTGCTPSVPCGQCNRG